MDEKDNSARTPLTSVSATEALEAILAHFAPLEPVEVSLPDALGMVLAEDVRSDIDVPPFANSSMDGYALLATDTQGASDQTPARLRVVGHIAAGKAPGADDRVSAGTAIRIMTGAPVPPGADAVIRFEDTNEGRALDTRNLQPGQARALPSAVGEDVLVYRPVKQGDSVRLAGEDMRAGEVVLEAGTLVKPAAIGVLATVGKARVLVHRRPRVAILSSGDELVEPGEKPGPGQIRNSNGYSVAAQVASWGAIPFNLGAARDDIDDVTARINQALDLQPDLLITSAGVSVGDHDVVKDVLLSMGTISMWRVRVKPGKPLAFGVIRREGGKSVPFLGLPGNPVSSMVSMELFGRPAIMKMLGKRSVRRPIITARALEQVEGAPGREHYVRAIVTYENGEFVARSAGKQESNIMTALARANALLVVDEKTRLIEPGQPVRALMLDWPEE